MTHVFAPRVHPEVGQQQASREVNAHEAVDLVVGVVQGNHQHQQPKLDEMNPAGQKGADRPVIPHQPGHGHWSSNDHDAEQVVEQGVGEVADGVNDVGAAVGRGSGEQQDFLDPHDQPGKRGETQRYAELLGPRRPLSRCHRQHHRRSSEFTLLGSDEAE